MKCPACGAEAVADAVFCQKCGARLDASERSDTTSSQAAPNVAKAPDAERDRLGRRIPADTPDEVLWEGGYSPKAMVGTWVLAAVIEAALIVGAIVLFSRQIQWWWIPLVVGVVFFLLAVAQLAARRLGIRYRLTRHRLYHERGILRRSVNRIQIIDIDDVASEQGFLERLFGVGRIKVISADRTDPELWMEGIEDVQRVTALIDDARRAERNRRGLFVQNI
jgi:membrane protein YdbS with pleckstrin-like domain